MRPSTARFALRSGWTSVVSEPFVSFDRLAQLLQPRAWPHRRVRAPVAAKIVSELGRTDYVRVQIDQRGGEPAVRPIMTSGASILSSTTRADGVVLVASEREGYGEGELVDVLLYD